MTASLKAIFPVHRMIWQLCQKFKRGEGILLNHHFKLLVSLVKVTSGLKRPKVCCYWLVFTRWNLEGILAGHLFKCNSNIAVPFLLFKWGVKGISWKRKDKCPPLHPLMKYPAIALRKSKQGEFLLSLIEHSFSTPSDIHPTTSFWSWILLIYTKTVCISWSNTCEKVLNGNTITIHIHEPSPLNKVLSGIVSCFLQATPRFSPFPPFAVCFLQCNYILRTAIKTAANKIH